MADGTTAAGGAPCARRRTAGLDRKRGSGYLWCTSRLQLPPDLYDILLAAWRASAGRNHGGASGSFTRDELYPVSRKVRDLSHGFTRERSLAGERYLSDPDLLGAYLLHFWPVSYAQARLGLEMIRAAREELPLGAALDIGAGPGPMSLALLDAGAGRVVACDRSGAALSLARRLASARGHSLHTRQWDALKSTGMPEGSYDLIILGHTLNELWAGHPDRLELRAGLLKRLADRLAPGGRFLVIEPALMQTAQDAIRVRDLVVREGFVVEMPCIWQAGCPALPQGTCHGEFEWRPPREMLRLAHAARIGRETLKMAWFVLKRAEAPAPAPPASAASPDASPDAGLYRVVSEPLLSKSGRIRYLVCGPMGRFALSAAKDCGGPGVKAFFTLRRGDSVRFYGAARRETGWGLDEGSRVELVERPPKIEWGHSP